MPLSVGDNACSDQTLVQCCVSMANDQVGLFLSHATHDHGMTSHIADSQSRWVGKPVPFESIELVVQEMETERGWTTSEMPVPSPVSFQQNGNLKSGSRLPCQLHFPDCPWRA